MARSEWRTEIDGLKKRVNAQQTVLDRLTAFMEKVLRKPKRNTPGEPPKA